MKINTYLLIPLALMAAACSNNNDSSGSSSSSSSSGASSSSSSSSGSSSSSSSSSGSSSSSSGSSSSSSGSTASIAAVVATVAPDFSSGAVSLVEATAPYNAQNTLNATTSDIVVRADGDHYFLIKRFGTDQIQRYDAATPTKATYTYSTNDPAPAKDSNPYDLIVLNETKAYLLRYGSGKIWIVNPSAATEAAFKTGEIDLSQYDADGVPQMSAGLIKNGKLYVALQRLDDGNNLAASQNGYVAVIDTATDAEITTGAAGAALKGIALTVRDPYRLVSVPGSDSIVVAADGGYDGSFAQQYDGGLVSINPDSSYATTLLLDDGDATTHPYGVLADMTIAAGDRGYFIGSTGFGLPQSLYRFNPASTATPVAVSSFQNLALGQISVDPNGNLWVGQTSSTAPGLSVLGFTGGTETVLKALIDTVLNPTNIDFVSVPTN